MLQAINDRAKGWLGITIVVLITLPFAFWGINSYIGGGNEQYIAKVNDVEISKSEFDYNLTKQRQQMQDQFGGKLPFEENVLKQRVIDQLVNRKLLEERSANAGYLVSDIQLSEKIKEIFTREGEFDREYVNQVLQSQGMSVAQMEYQLKSDLQVSQVIEAFTNTSFITDSEAKKIAELEYQQRKITTLTFALDHFSAGINITEEEIQAAYEKDSERYMSVEKVSIEYVELKSEALSGDVEIDEQMIATMYEEYVDVISKKEKRKAKHILLKTDDEVAARTQMADLIKQLAEGASFEDLAREHSQDIGSAKQGGDLGWVESGQMVKSFEDTLYALKVGAVSEVVESEFGLHLIKLEDVKSEEIQSLNTKRAELEQAFKQDIISDKFYELSELMASTAYENSDSLMSVTEALNVEAKSSGYFTRDQGADITANEKVRAAAFSKLVLKEKSNSDVIEISPEHILVLRVLEHEAASRLPLDSVRSSIENGLRLRKSHENTMAAAIAAKEKVNVGEATMADLAAKGITLKTSEMLTRKDMTKIDPMILETAFNISASEEGKLNVSEVSMYSGDVALVVVDEVFTPNDIAHEKIDAIKNQLKRDVSNREFNSALAAMKDKASLHINSKVLQ